MKYKILKEISLLTIAQAGPKGCKEFQAQYISLSLKMRHHDFPVGTWIIIPNHDHETKYAFKSFIKWAEDDPRRMEWLVNKGFLRGVEELKPCPFCGGEATIIDFSNSGYHDFCIECKNRCERKHFRTREQSVELWNRRA